MDLGSGFVLVGVHVCIWKPRMGSEMTRFLHTAGWKDDKWFIKKMGISCAPDGVEDRK